MIYKKLDYKSTTAQILLNIKAINFNIEKPYILTSGRKSHVYVDSSIPIHSWPISRRPPAFGYKMFVIINDSLSFHDPRS